MKLNSEVVSGSCGTLLCFFGLTISVTQVQAIFSLIATILGLVITLFTFITKVLVPFIKKYKEAKKDGKITVEELEDIANDTKKNLEEFKDEIEKSDEKN